MRIDVNAKPGQPGYQSPSVVARTQVTIDGVTTHDCIVADEEEGYAVVYSRGPDGRLEMNADRTALVTRRVAGVVRLVFDTAHEWLRTGDVVDVS